MPFEGPQIRDPRRMAGTVSRAAQVCEEQHNKYIKRYYREKGRLTRRRDKLLAKLEAVEKQLTYYTYD